MHMADALLSPAVGGTMWAAAAATIAYSADRLRREPDDRRIPLMGVLGAFLFAAQMINFSIPGTGSSGHLGGGLLLAILLGPYAAFLVMASVLIVQALFFADGGLLALGCNIFNLGFFSAFIGLPLYRKLAGSAPRPRRAAVAAVAAAVVSLQLGAAAVVLETVGSGISALPLGSFALFMLPIHLAIGVVEGLVTAAIVAFLLRTRPDLVTPVAGPAGRGRGGVVAAMAVAALALGGIGAWFASDQPDGLEWSIARVAGGEQPGSSGAAVQGALARLQQRIALLPDYGFPRAQGPVAAKDEATGDLPDGHDRLATSASGILGSVLVLLLALLVGLASRQRTGSS